MSAGTRTAISWSAGKDSCLALLRARDSGLVVSTFVTLCEPDGTSKSHVLPAGLVAAQVAAFGADWLQVPVATDAYAATFEATLRRLRDDGHAQMVFGDIDLQAHRDWIEGACAKAGLQPLFPLWGERRDAVAAEVIARGIRAIVVVVDTRRLDASFAGAHYDAALLARLPDDVCPCGEEGEFHTFVFDAPGMSAALVLRAGARHEFAARPPFAPARLVSRELLLEGSRARASQ